VVMGLCCSGKTTGGRLLLPGTSSRTARGRARRPEIDGERARRRGCSDLRPAAERRWAGGRGRAVPDGGWRGCRCCSGKKAGDPSARLRRRRSARVRWRRRIRQSRAPREDAASCAREGSEQQRPLPPREDATSSRTRMATPENRPWRPGIAPGGHTIWDGDWSGEY
jgi:hypothetical protein